MRNLRDMMHRYIKFGVAAILLFVFVFPIQLQATNLYIKMSLGINTGGIIQDLMPIPAMYSPYVTVENNPKPKLGMDAAFELLYHFTPRIGLAFGYGYLSGGKKAETAEITAVGLDFPFTGTPRYDWEANSIYVTGIYALPFSPSFKLNLGVGAAYYLAKLKHRTSWITGIGSGGDIGSDSFNWDHSSQNWGFHITSGFDFTLFENMFFTLDVLYRFAEFDSHVIELDTSRSSTIHRLEWIEQQIIPYVEYEVIQLGISGFAFRGGIKFRF